MNNPIFIIGAPRSGTNLLRDIITSNKDFVTWDCDEINLIWLYKNFNKSSDRLVADDVDPNKKKFIEKFFWKLQRKNPEKNIVEKTCANSMRINYIKEIFPDAKFILIHRNNLDCISSTLIKRKNKFDFYYSWKKARYVRLDILIHYVLLKIFGSEKSSWGVRTKEGASDSLQNSIDIWKNCISYSISDLKKLNNKDWYTVEYEELISNKFNVIEKLFKNFLKTDIGNETLKFLDVVHDKSVGGYTKNLNNDMIAKIIHETKVIQESINELHINKSNTQ